MTYAFLHPRCSSPIQMLPVELLSYIFTLAAHEADEGHGFPTIDAETIKIPLIISRVNHHWRNVAYQTPYLWNSICVTGALIELKAGQGGHLNTMHISTHLALSHNCPLDILIDARDEQWDFQEPGIENITEYESPIYEPPFTLAHMRKTISLLLPHMFRWRSLSILTDSWAQMYVALQEIQPFITVQGAPCLEALTLMRCNDFISYSPTFAPSDMRLPAFLDISNTTTSCQNLLPRLRHLTLRGVHLNWSSLSYILSKADYSLKSLELSSHSLDVRPTVHEFHQLLSQCPHLTSLVVNGSGLLTPTNYSGTSILSEDIQPVSLPRLRDMTLGYRSVIEGQAILQIMDAPYVEFLALEDESLPGAVDDLKVGTLLSYIATRSIPEPIKHDNDPFIYTTLDGEIAVDKFDFMIPNTKSPISNLSGNTASRAIFPRLHALTLKGVNAHETDIHHFLDALQHLRRLEFQKMSIQSIRALHPRRVDLADGFSAISCPCPQLQYLCIRKAEHALEDLLCLIGAVSRERFKSGGSALQSIDIYVNQAQTHWPVENAIQLSNVGTMVRIIREEPLFDEDDSMDCDTDSDLDSAFEIGGVFNDPVFDAQYGVLSG